METNEATCILSRRNHSKGMGARIANKSPTIACFCSAMGNGILKQFQIYYVMEQMSICVGIVGSKGSHCGSRNI